MKKIITVSLMILVSIGIVMISKQKSGFTISSSGVKSDGSLSIEYTGEGKGVSMPLEWTNVPEGTKCFALNLWHYPKPSDPSEVKSYWVLYNIPPDTKNLLENVRYVGTLGYNDKDKASYDPMKSKGPGVKEYNVTIYALSEKLIFSKEKVYRTDLLNAIKGKVLGESTLKYTYETGKTKIKRK
ncbi:MAG: YbhB/YbcL family Raf kinase inhibitor-like protein [Candidatus Delongbacteria bacterium]|jgi:phosphatidylethanolamine-binding protein (PEBP) family uncharacterized protein|nr:YbhB/YbcL family Raf kinase inhibitor-like protein [Candidatus Delongbacteria bacterium]